MSRPDSSHILMVYPPPAAPSAPPFQMAWRVVAPEGQGLPMTVYDANLDFYVRYLLNQKHLNRFLDVIEAKKAHGEYGEISPDMGRVLADLSENRPQWKKRIAGIDQFLAMCREEGFYHPENSVTALNNITDLLNMASLAFYPLRIRWDSCDHPAGADPNRILFFARDVSNPFQAICESGLAPKLKMPGLRLLLLWISSEAQLPAAATMAVFSKKINPGLHLAVAGVPGVLGGSKRFADSQLILPDSQLFTRLRQLMGGKGVDRAKAGPDFSRFLHDDYLAPAFVPFFDLRQGGVDLDPPMGLVEFIKSCQEKMRPSGMFISVDEDLDQYFPGAVSAADDNRTATGVGICARLCETSQKIDTKSLLSAGVRLIVWRAPEGSTEALKKVLWKMSRDGIWNHLQISKNGDAALNAALLLFAAANPNIVHSWNDTRCTAAAADDSPGPDAPTVYQRVRKLPGKPLWRILKDPVHLLLYLMRHGREKVMRWRVADDGTTVYTLGRRLEFHYAKPENLPSGDLDEICEMVADGGSVDMQRVRYNLERAYLIAYVLEDGVIVGNSSLKNPRPEYIESVNRQAGLNLASYVERGYTSVRPEYRGMGIGARLLSGLTEKAGARKVFSVIGADNVAAQKMAIRNRTRQVAEYVSPLTGKRVGIWIPEWMLE